MEVVIVFVLAALVAVRQSFVNEIVSLEFLFNNY